MLHARVGTTVEEDGAPVDSGADVAQVQLQQLLEVGIPLGPPIARQPILFVPADRGSRNRRHP